ncbi:coiled-coil domain-containing protein 43 isoform X4 [Rousettus aegyptiacus]|uniref:coiled-coil domain-containing protein 43 isoform X4 n=1 Tax=Rousettus aegyptiacus TaxID=9407 RepID=UPI00168CF8DC|nr:coiled-coil domain-containing protein 43 isoform X4 [Rousettus aegyptiacus]
MAAPSEVDAASSGEGDGGGSGFGSWLDERLEALGVDRAVYGAYILGVLQEEEEEEKLDALQGILSAFLEEDSLLNICKEIVERWSETQSVVTKVKKEDEVQAIATLIEKQAQIVVKPRMVSEEEKQRKAALLAQYADVTDEEEYPFQSLGTISRLKLEAFAGNVPVHLNQPKFTFSLHEQMRRMIQVPPQ